MDNSMEQLSEFENDIKPTMVEDLLSWVNEGKVKVKYIPTIIKKPYTIIVSKYKCEGLSDRLNKDIGFFIEESTGKTICLTTSSIKWIEFIGE